jgi:uncharacterized protein YraI
MKPRSFVAAAAFACALAVPGVASAANAFATGNVNLRAGPSTDYPVVITVAVNAPVDLHGCLTGYSWCDVSYSGARGWVSGKYLETVYQEERVLVPAYATRVNVPVISFSFGTYWDNNYRGRDFIAIVTGSTTAVTAARRAVTVRTIVRRFARSASSSRTSASGSTSVSKKLATTAISAAWSVCRAVAQTA